jgi:two-component system NtrC family sensor kinase
MAGEKILVIDDSDKLRSLLDNILPYAGYSVVSAGTGQQGLQLVSEEQPDAILIDLELPDTSGLKVLEILNEQGISIPTIMMTGYGSEGIAARALRLGVRDYLIKPFTMEEVLSSTERALSESRLRRRNKKLSVLLKNYDHHFRIISAVGQAAASGLRQDQFLQRVVEAGRFGTGAEVGLLLLLDTSSSQLEVEAVHGETSCRKQGISPRSGDERLQPVLGEGVSVRIGSASDPVIEIQTGDLVNAVLQVPFRVYGEVSGILSMDRRADDTPFGEHDKLVLQILADYVSMVLERDLRLTMREGRATT